MFAVAALSFTVNATVLRLLRRYREGEVHLRASWIFTRADVIANLGVIVAGSLVLWTGSRFPELRNRPVRPKRGIRDSARCASGARACLSVRNRPYWTLRS